MPGQPVHIFSWMFSTLITSFTQIDRDNFNLDSTDQAGQVRNKERNSDRCRPGEARPGRTVTPAVGAGRASAAGSEEPEAATDVGRRRDAPRPVRRASEGRRPGWRGAVDNLPQRVRTVTAEAPPEKAGQRKEEGTQETRPHETGRQGQHPEVGRPEGDPWSMGA